MSEPARKYDVAISFRWPDREHARALYESLRDRLEVFYSEERMEEIAGTDGEKTFSEVFHDHCRVAVIFYREDWGETPFTRPEKTAIKRRGFEAGYGFSLWIPMSDLSAVPAFVPRQNLWVDFERLGIDGLTAAVENAVQRSGTGVRPPSTLDELRQIDRKIALEEERGAFIGSERAVEFIQQAQAQLQSLVEAKVEEYRRIREIPFQVEKDRNGCTVTSWPHRRKLQLGFRYANTARDTQLRVFKWRGKGNSSAVEHWGHPRNESFEPTLDENGQPSWKSPSGKYLSLPEVIAEVLDPMAKSAFRGRHERMKNQ